MSRETMATQSKREAIKKAVNPRRSSLLAINLSSTVVFLARLTIRVNKLLFTQRTRPNLES
jgi:hypothetical protein